MVTSPVPCKPVALGKRISRSRKRLVPGRFLAFCALVGVLVAYASAYGGVLRLRGRLAVTRAEAVAWREANRELEHRLEYLKSDEYVESVARRDLGLVKEGEVLVVLSPAGQGKPVAP